MARKEILAFSPLKRYPIAVGAEIAIDQLVALNAAGDAVPASDTAGLTVVGIATDIIDGEVEVVAGIFAFENSATAPLTRLARGKAAYVEASGIVAASSTNSIVAGGVIDVYDGEVFVDITPVAIAAVSE